MAGSDMLQGSNCSIFTRSLDLNKKPSLRMKVLMLALPEAGPQDCQQKHWLWRLTYCHPLYTISWPKRVDLLKWNFQAIPALQAHGP